MDTRKEREPIYVPVRKRERREEPLRQIDELPPNWKPAIIPNRWRNY